MFHVLTVMIYHDFQFDVCLVKSVSLSAFAVAHIVMLLFAFLYARHAPTRGRKSF